MGGGGKTYLAPPHIFEWGGGGGSDTPRPPVPTPLYNIYILILYILARIRKMNSTR